MSATIEVKYFNTFLIKKLKSVVEATTKPTAPFANVPSDYVANTTYDWYIEEARIRGGYNNTIVDLGVKAYLDELEPLQQDRFNTLIYSGIFNSRTGINDTNQFSVGQDITRSADPANGKIMKLYAEDTNLIIFQQNKVSRALIDKDAIYSAEGNAAVTSSNLVIGQIVAYAGEYGISNDPFSFAVYGYRKYFTDRARGCVLRLSADGITEISSYGMHDFFRDELAESVQQIRAGWDAHNKNYVLSIQKTDNSYKTLTFDESVLGWTSFFDYKPDFITSLKNNFYSLKITTNNGQGVWLHNTGSYGKFYEIAYDSNVTVILNKEPSLVKNFKTINYEGSDGWQLESMTASSGDVSVPIGKYALQTTLSSLESDLFVNNFKRKENKFFANLINNSPAAGGEVLWGPSSTGLKGFFTEAKIKLINSDYPTTKKELFAVSSDIVESSY
tara:strand:- start:5473 stop:6807 length:1335 start_codon:yes stop_codon:yes gene_type:complete